MVVGTASVELLLYGVYSLKEKRAIVRRVVHRLRNEFSVSVAEVASLDEHAKATIGIAVVTNDGRLANSLLDQMVNALEGYGEAELGRVNLELLHV